MQVKVFHKKDMFTYDRWYRERQITEEELNAQREYRFSYNPKFSIVVPLYRTKESYLRAMIDSVAGQTYTNWELCLIDGSGEGHTIEKIVADYQNKGIPIKDQVLSENLGISENTNAAIKMATGEYIVLEIGRAHV